jgi:hypothetical protein
MSRFYCNILRNFGHPKRLHASFLLAMVALLTLIWARAEAQSDSWRRTAYGWEKTESWEHLVTAPIGQLRPLTIGTLVQRSWPATIAAAELSLVLAILNFGRASELGKSE